MKDADQIAAEAARDIFTRYLELKGMFREEDCLHFIRSAIEKAMAQHHFKDRVPEVSGKFLLSRAAHAHEKWTQQHTSQCEIWCGKVRIGVAWSASDAKAIAAAHEAAIEKAIVATESRCAGQAAEMVLNHPRAAHARTAPDIITGEPIEFVQEAAHASEPVFESPKHFDEDGTFHETKPAHASEQEIEKLPGFWCWSQKGYPIFSSPPKRI